MKNNLSIIILIFFSTLLFSCQTLNETLGGKKRSNQSDEFLVEKKNPLTMPPDFEKLPTPGNEEFESETLSNNNEVKELLSVQSGEKLEDQNDNNSSDIESSILEKIQ